MRSSRFASRLRSPLAGLAALTAARLSQPIASQELIDLGPRLEPIVAAGAVPALGAGVLREGRLCALGVSGVRKRGSDVKATTDDLWHLGSCTKAMTATLLAVLVERGQLQWSATLADLLPAPDFSLHAERRDTTVRQLLEHRAGFARDLPPAIWLAMTTIEDQHAARTQAVRALLLSAPSATVHPARVYSNSGYLVAGVIAEQATGKSWEELMRQLVFTPLGMTSAGFGAPGGEGAIEQPYGHRAGAGHAPVPPGSRADNPASLGPAGTVHASLRDWAKFIALHLGTGSEAAIVGKDTLATLHDPGDDDYALGWVVVDRPWSQRKVLAHSGSNTFWYATVWAAPAEAFAMFAVCNQGGDQAAKACDDACSAVLEVARAMPAARK